MKAYSGGLVTSRFLALISMTSTRPHTTDLFECGLRAVLQLDLKFVVDSMVMTGDNAELACHITVLWMLRTT